MTAQPCTPVGATSGTFETAHLAPFFVQHRAGFLAPPSVQHTLHPRRCNIEYPYLLTQYRHALACKTDVFPYRTFRRLPLTYRTNKATTDRVRGEESANV